MVTSKEYLEYILDRLSGVEGITYRSMMGEYIIYCNGRILAYVCDDRFLVKPVKAAERLMPDAVHEPPYDGAKPMILVENTDDREFMKKLVEEVYDELPLPKKKKKLSN